MKELPKYFVIKRDPSNPKWEEYVEWFKKESGFKFNNGAPEHNYYGGDGSEGYNGFDTGNSIECFINSPTLITLEQWDEVVNPFVLPEKWAIEPIDKSIVDWFNRNSQTSVKDYLFPTTWKYMHYPICRISHIYPEVQDGYTEITFAQFKQYVLKENDMAFINPPINLIENSDLKYCNIMKDRTITAQQAQSIIDVACTTWKMKLAKNWGEGISLKNPIRISESEYQEMRSVCLPEQHTLFDSIFGKDKKEFNASMLKRGEFIKTNLGYTFIKTEDGLVSLGDGSSTDNDLELYVGKKVKFEEVND